MTRKTIHSIREQDTIREVYRLAERVLRTNKNGNAYLQFTLSDKTGSLAGRMWNVAESVHAPLHANDYVLVEGAVQRFQGSLQLIAKSLQRVEPSSVNPADFAASSEIDHAALLTRLREHLASLTHPTFIAIANAITSDSDLMSRFIIAPAALKVHHAYSGGLLEHSVTMMDVVVAIAPLYPNLNSELLLLGAFLHDLGKVDELPTGNETSYTNEGQLLGHSLLGVERLNIAIATTATETLPLDATLITMLKHCIIAHHGSYEHQAAKLPMFPEAMVVHLVDLLDAKIAEFRKCLLDDPNTDSAWTNFIPTLNRKLFRAHKQ